jgi:hypothetical protein
MQVGNLFFFIYKYQFMKQYFILLLIINFSIASRAQDKNEVPFLTKSFANESIKNVEAETSGGSITVMGVPAGQARVEVFVWPNDNRNSNSMSKEEIQKRLDEDYKLTVSVANNKLTTIAEAKNKIRNWKHALSISFKIYVPGEVSTELTTSGGSIHLADLTGNQHFTTSGGSLHADKLKGKIKGRTSGGSIHAKDCDDDIDLSTSGGSIEADNCTGKIRLVTSGGSLHLNNLNGVIDATTSGGSVHGELIKGELEAHTSGGNIDLEKLSCSLVTSTSGGSIDVEIIELGKYAKISNSGGNIDVELPNKGLDLKVKGSKIKTNNLSNFSGSVEDEKLDGKLNGGGVPVTITANSGRVSLVLK